MDKIETCLPIFKEQLDKLVVFDEAEWAIFKQHLHLKVLQKKDYFIRQGEVCKDVGFIVSGSVRFFHVKDGEERTNYFCMDNEFVSSYKSFLTQQPSFTNLQVLEDAVMLTFSYKSVQQLVENKVTAYKMERFGRLTAEYLICCYEDRVQSFVTQTPEERYIDLLNSNSKMLQRIPQHYLANFLGITPVSLSRIRKRIFETVK